MCVDNTANMRRGAALLALIFRLLFIVGCAARVMDLLAEDLAKIDEVAAVVGSCKVIIHYLKGHRAFFERVSKRCCSKKSVPHLFPETRFSYAFQMMVDVCSIMCVLMAMEQDDSFRAANFDQEFADIIHNPTFWSQLQLFTALFKPVSLAITAVGGDYSNMSCIFPIFELGIMVDILKWITTAHNPFLQPLSILAVQVAVIQRWTGRSMTNGPLHHAFVWLRTPAHYR